MNDDTFKEKDNSLENNTSESAKEYLKESEQDVSGNNVNTNNSNTNNANANNKNTYNTNMNNANTYNNEYTRNNAFNRFNQANFRQNIMQNIKDIEIVELKPFSVFKVSLYLLALPAIIFLVIGMILVFAGIAGISAGSGKMIALVGMGIYFIVIIIFYMPATAGINTLLSLIYNLLAKKFGGLIIKYKDNR